MGSEMNCMSQMQGLAGRAYPIVGSAFLVCMGYIDPAKWATAIEGGSHFGFELVWLLVLFNVVGILCQSVAARIGLVTGKQLAQICAEEYPQPVCLLLWLQCELSVMALNFTTILGIAIGLNILVDLDMSLCVIMSILDALVFPIVFPRLGKRHAEVLSVAIIGLMIFFFVIDTLSTEQNVTFVMNGMLPRMRRESLFTAVGILGANIMPHNFYLHSSIVQEQKRVESVSIGTLSHYNVLEITIAFSGILLINLALLNSSATTFHNAGLEVLTFEDAKPLIDQAFKSSIPLTAFFLVIYCASQLSTLTGTAGAQIALEGFLGVHPRLCLHSILIKAGAVILAMFCIWNTGASSIYQLLILSQVILAMQLPSAVIPLFRVASASSIMGTHKVSFIVEVLAWLSFFCMLILNLSLVLEMCFWDSDWMGFSRWNTGTGIPVPFVMVLMVAIVSFGLMLWLIATPLRSANDKVDIQLRNDEQRNCYEHSEDFLSKETVEEVAKYEEASSAHVEIPGIMEAKSDEPLPGKDLKIYSKENGVVSMATTVLEDEFPSEIIPAINLPRLSEVKSSNDIFFPDSSTSLSSVGMELSPMSVPRITSESPSTNSVENLDKCSPGDLDSSAFKEVGVEADAELEKDDDDYGDAWEHEDVPTELTESVSSLTYEEPGSGRSVGGRSDDGGSGNGSLARLSGLGRAARRQFAADLDEFWGKLFDFHGQLTQQAKVMRVDLVLGLKASQYKVNVTSNGPVARQNKYLLEQQRTASRKSNTTEHLSHVESCMQTSEQLSGMHSSMGINTCGAISASQYSSVCSQDPYGRQATPSFPGDERRYSSLHLPAYRKEFDYQPATIHGCKMASYMGRSGSPSQGMNANSRINFRAGGGLSLSTQMDDAMRNVAVGTGFDELRTPGYHNAGYESHGLPSGQSAYDNSFSSQSFLRSNGNNQYAGQTKKYHSLPDIYGRGISQWDPLTGHESNLWSPLLNRDTGGLDMGYASVGNPSNRMNFSQMQVSHSPMSNDRINCQVEQLPSVFDELSPSRYHKDAFLNHSMSNNENNSLWSRQPFEQLFGMSGVSSWGVHGYDRSGKSRPISSTSISCADTEVEMLRELRNCIAKLHRLDGSDWLFHQHDELDEWLIDLVAAREKFFHEADASASSSQHRDRKLVVSVSSVPQCGEDCVWGASLLVSFGVWCIHRILELCLMESRPELWGKYTYVLNRLQGILDPAFFKSRQVLPPCLCLQFPGSPDVCGRRMCSLPSSFSNELSVTSYQSYSQRATNAKGKSASASAFLEIIKDVEMAVASRKGRTGTAAGDVAFPKGKENLASVLKRYKRRLANKPQGLVDNSGGSRKVL